MHPVEAQLKITFFFKENCSLKWLARAFSFLYIYKRSIYQSSSRQVKTQTRISVINLIKSNHTIYFNFKKEHEYLRTYFKWACWDFFCCSLVPTFHVSTSKDSTNTDNNKQKKDACLPVALSECRRPVAVQRRCLPQGRRVIINRVTVFHPQSIHMRRGRGTL